MNIPIRFTDNVETLKKHLAEGLNQIEATTAAAEKLAQYLGGEKLIRSAHNWAAAIEKAGGVTKLTASEQQQANAVLTKAIEKYAALGKTAPASMIALAEATKKVEPPTSTASRVMGDLSKQVVATAAGLVSGQAVIGAINRSWQALTSFVSDSVQAYGEAEAAQKKLTTALLAQGRATPEVIAGYNAMAMQFQKTTVYGDDLINSMQALLVQVGNVMPADMERALKAATNLAAGLGIDLESATQLVAKAAAGHTETLGRYGIKVDEAALKTEGFSAVLDVVEQHFGGQAQAQLDTYAGRLQKLGNDWNNVQEAVGKAITSDPIILGLLTEIGDAAEKAGDSSEGFGWSIAGLSSRFAFVAPMLNQHIQGLNDAQKVALELRKANDELAASMPNVPHVAVPAAPLQPTRDPIQGLGETEKLAFATQDAAAAVGVLTEEQRKASVAAFQHGVSLNQTIDILSRYWPAITRNREAVSALFEQLKKAADAEEELRKKHEAWLASVDAATTSAGLTVFTLNRLGAVELPNVSSGFATIRDEVADFVPTLDDANASAEDLGRAGQLNAMRLKRMGDEGNRALGLIADGSADAAERMKKLNDQSRQSTSIFDGMKASLQGLWEGLTGGKDKGVKGLFSQVGKGVTDELGRMLTGGITTAINVGLNLLAKGFKNLFGIGPSQQELEGRDVADKFEKQFGSLQEMLQQFSSARQALGDDLATANRTATQWANELWAAEKRGAGAVQEVIDKIKQSMDAAAEQADLLREASSLYGPSSTDLQAAADKARKIFETMLQAGTFTQEQLDKAYRAFQEALAATGDEAAKAWLEANAAVSDFADLAERAGFKSTEQLRKEADEARRLAEYMRDSGRFTADQVKEAFERAEAAGDAALGISKELREERDRLQKAVDAEAPEEEMGAIEKANRARLEEIRQQQEAARQNAAVNAEAQADTAEAAEDAADRYADGWGKAGAAARREFDDTVDRAQVTADAIARAFKDLQFTIPIDFAVGPGPTGPTVRADAAMDGGLVLPSGRLQHFDRGGVVRSFPGLADALLPSIRLAMPPGPDDQLVWTHPGELIMNEAQHGRIAEDLRAAHALARATLTNVLQPPPSPTNGGGAAPVRVHNAVDVYLDGERVTDNVITRVGRDKRGAGTKMRRALGVRSS